MISELSKFIKLLVNISAMTAAVAFFATVSDNVVVKGISHQ